MGGDGGTISNSEARIGALQVQQSTYGACIPIVYGRTRISCNLIWYGDFTAIATTTTTTTGGKGGGGVSQSNTTYTYEAAAMLSLCEGPISGVVSAWRGKERFTSLPLATLGLSLTTGTAGQPIWSFLQTNHPTQAVGYSSTAYLFSPTYQLTTGAQVDNHSFEIDGILPYGSGIVDANPKDIVTDFLTNAQYGANFPIARVGDLTNYSNYCRAMGLFASPAYSEQQEARQHLDELAQLSNSAFVWSEGLLKVVPYGDAAIAGNSATYTPNLTPIYDLTDDDFLVADKGEDPVKCNRKTTADAFNRVQIEYLNRGNAYNVEIAEAKDQANIEKFGLRPQDPIRMHGICDATVARRVAQLVLQRALYIRNGYEFKLGWKYALLEPMDLVTLTDVGLGLNKAPVRITSVEEDGEGELAVLAEDYPFGSAHATQYPSQAGLGYAHDYNVASGNVSVPTFFEPPVQLTTTGLEVWCAVSGANNFWGGCTVWASLDGSTYKRVGRVNGGSRYGTLTAAIPATTGGTASVALTGNGGQMLSGTAQDAQLLNTLCWVDGTNGGEFFAYQTATLTGASAYNLTGLVRGAYGSDTSAKAANSRFVRIDQAIAKSEPLDASLVGKTIYFKFTSFNIYQGGEQDLSAVSAYAYTITGNMLRLPPSTVSSVQYVLEGFGVRISWNPVSDPDVSLYEIRYGGSTWANSTFIAQIKSTNFLWATQAAGTYPLWVKAVDAYGNYSIAAASVLATVALPGVVALNAVFSSTNYVLTWQQATSSFKLSRYRVRRGATFNIATLIAEPQSTRFEAKADWIGDQNFWVSAVDVGENEGAAAQITLTESPPGTAQNFRATVENNRIYFFWDKPASVLPLAIVRLSVGATLATAVKIGDKPGDHTFTPHFELTAGTRTYWLQYQNSAGDWGAAVSLQVTCQAPPDFILRNAIDSAFTGTKVNIQAVPEGYAVPLAAQTWAQAQGTWTTPQAKINAGYPLFLQPAATTGSYEEVVDYGTTLGATTVTLEQQVTTVSGTVTMTYQIAYKLNAGDAWTLAPANATSVLISNFRYVRYTVTYTGADDKSLININRLSYRLSLQNRSDDGLSTANAADANGTRVFFNYPFTAISSLQLTANDVNAVAVTYVLQAGANPTYFDVKVFDKNGTRLTCQVTWLARGF